MVMCKTVQRDRAGGVRGGVGDVHVALSEGGLRLHRAAFDFSVYDKFVALIRNFICH